MLQKDHFRGPISALHHINGPEEEIILWGSGGELHVHHINDSHESSIRVFETHNIHGIKSIGYECSGFEHHVVVFGDKSIALVQMSSHNLCVTHLFSVDDLVLDCMVRVQNSVAYLLIACAHNMIDVRAVTSSTETTLCHRFLCPKVSVLFAMSFLGVIDGVIRVAAGSVFGHLYIWECPFLSSGDGPSQGTMVAEARRHEGVIFRIVWNRHGDELITVSDDRTARLWSLSANNLDQICEAWGHVCRLWDAVFTDATEQEIATCSEDGTVRLWNRTGQCTAVLSGHIDSVWRLVALPAHVSAPTLVSVGNDSAVKFWDLAHHRMCCPAVEDSTLRQIAIPQRCDEGEEILPNRRANGVNTIRFSTCGNLVVIVLIDGPVWVMARNHEDDFIWSEVANLHATVVTADVHLQALGESNHWSLSLVCALLDRKCVLMDLLLTPVEDQIASRKLRAQPVGVGRWNWCPHEMKCVNVWVVTDDTGSGVVVCTATTRGVCSTWRVSGAEVTATAHLETARKEIACSFALLDSSTVAVGDSRGGITVWSIGEEVASFSSPAQYFHKVHGTEPVSCMRAWGRKGFVSTGHDGTVSFFDRRPLQGNEGPQRWIQTHSMSVHPIHTPDQLLLVNGGEEGKGLSSVIVAGYHGSSYMVVDVLRSYQLMRIEGGGWKRPHRACLALPAASTSSPLQRPHLAFVCPVPLGKTQTALHWCSTPEFGLSVPGATAYPLQLHASCFGRVSYCSVLIAPDPSSSVTRGAPDAQGILVVGGEDCTLKAFALPSLQLVQETTLSKNSSLKAMHACASLEDPGRGIVLGAGGKLLYYVYAYAFDGRGSMPLRTIAIGSVWPKATQDHRILAARCAAIPSADKNMSRFLLWLGDSRGVLSVLVVENSFDPEAKASRVFPLYEVELSANPLLAIATVQLSGGSVPVFACCVGDTKGRVHVVLCGADGAASVRPQPVANLQAHSMGSNAVDVAVVSSNPEANTHRLFVSSGGDDQSLTVHLLEMEVEIRNANVGVRCWKLGEPLRVPAAGAALKGSSLIRDRHGRFCIASVAYDQRLGLWDVTMDTVVARKILSDVEWPHTGSSPLCDQAEDDGGPGESSDCAISLTWRDGCLVNLAEISSLFIASPHLNASEELVMVVVGQGFQVIRCNL